MSLYLPPSALSDSEWKRRASLNFNTLAGRLGGYGTTSERSDAPREGDYRWNTTTKKPEWWNGTTWITTP